MYCNWTGMGREGHLQVGNVLDADEPAQGQFGELGGEGETQGTTASLGNKGQGGAVKMGSGQWARWDRQQGRRRPAGPGRPPRWQPRRRKSLDRLRASVPRATFVNSLLEQAQEDLELAFFAAAAHLG